ncbi:methyl-accepting chemotaxis protein [Desulfobacterales bacterium HSG2]|nr:methyl-accepting chemotaxis protein [Desulfobacterales bacterium HSG2]
MNKLLSVWFHKKLFHKGIPVKLFLINLLICLMVGVITVAVFFSFRYMKNEFIGIFAGELGQVIRNAGTGRELARVLADTNLVISTFYGKEKFLKSEGERLSNKIHFLMAKSADAKLKKSLDEFILKIQAVFRQCAVVNHVRRDIEAISREIDNTSLSLGEMISEKIVSAITDNSDVSIPRELPLIISQYRETLLRLNLRFTELGLEYFESPLKKEKHPLLPLLDNLQLKVRPMAAYDSDIAAYGKSLTEKVRRYRDTIFQFHEAAGKLREQLNGMNHEKEALLIQMGKSDKRIAKRAEEGVAVLTKRIYQGVTAGGMTAFVVTMAVVILTSLLGRSITKSLKLVVTRLRDIAEGEGDLTIRLEVKSGDELGELATWFNLFVESLQDIIKDIADNAKDINAFASDMSSVSGLMSSGADEVSAKSNSVASSAEEMSVNIRNMASSAEEINVSIQTIFSTADQMSRNMNSVASAVREMSASITNISGNAREGAEISTDASDMAKKATATMNTLGDAVREIGVVIKIIRKIAEDTNLLALNARIEAASAGDAGRGFAVVANEIKELANQSAHAARDVARRIEEVQRHTEVAIRVIDSVSDIISAINDSVRVITHSVEQQTQASNEISSNIFQSDIGVSNIADSIAEISEGVNDMSRNAGEAAKGTNDVAADIQIVSDAAKESSVGARLVNTSAVELARVAGQLEKLISKFKVT